MKEPGIVDQAREALTLWGTAINPVAAAAASAAMADVLARIVGPADSDDPWQDPSWLEYAKHARETLEPMIDDASVAMAFYSGSVDPQMAIQTGYMVLLDKPIIALITPGVKAPKKLVGVADEIVEGDPSDPTLGPRVQAAMDRITAREKAQENGDPAP